MAEPSATACVEVMIVLRDTSTGHSEQHVTSIMCPATHLSEDVIEDSVDAAGSLLATALAHLKDRAQLVDYLTPTTTQE